MVHHVAIRSFQKLHLVNIHWRGVVRQLAPKFRFEHMIDEV
jgi:hypothetical protein